MPVVPSSPILSVVDDSDPLLGELADVPAASDGLLQLIAKVPDPRKARGKRHALPGVLAITLTATLAGARWFVAIAAWAADVAPSVLARLGVANAVPWESTIRRCLQKLAPDLLDAVRTTTIDGRRVIAFNGKTWRGARDAAGDLVHLLAGLCQATNTVLAQLAVGAKTNEIPMLPTLVDTIDITDAVITADALCRYRHKASYAEVAVMPIWR